MFGRVISVGIVTFWLVMMTLLIRTELLERSPLGYSVPVDTVMQKMFEGQGLSDLVIEQNGNRVGTCSIQIIKDKGTSPPTYRVHTDLNLGFDLFKRQLRLVSSTDSYFDHRYEMTRFSSVTTSGDTKVMASGDLASNELELSFSLGDVKEVHKLPFSTLESMGPSGAMGLLGVGGLRLPRDGSDELARPMVSAFAPSDRGPVTTVHETYLMVGKERVQTLAVHTKYDESVWSKVYVNPLGEILKVETSFGITMHNAELSATAAAAN